MSLREDETLTEALASLGIRHEPGGFHKRKLFKGEEPLGEFDVTEGWELVRRLRAEGGKP